jgi:hypothetical protein
MPFSPKRDETDFERPGGINSLRTFNESLSALSLRTPAVLRQQVGIEVNASMDTRSFSIKLYHRRSELDRTLLTVRIF